jgi:hypothetical protein
MGRKKTNIHHNIEAILRYNNGSKVVKLGLYANKTLNLSIGI